MKSHVSRFRVTYLTACVAVASAVGAEFAALKDMPVSDIHAKTWAFWVALGAAVLVNAGNTIIAALHPAPEPKQPTPPPFSPQI
jgi:hypothetical protein